MPLTRELLLEVGQKTPDPQTIEVHIGVEKILEPFFTLSTKKREIWIFANLLVQILFLQVKYCQYHFTVVAMPTGIYILCKQNSSLINISTTKNIQNVNWRKNTVYNIYIYPPDYLYNHAFVGFLKNRFLPGLNICRTEAIGFGVGQREILSVSKFNANLCICF